MHSVPIPACIASEVNNPQISARIAAASSVASPASAASMREITSAPQRRCGFNTLACASRRPLAS